MIIKIKNGRGHYAIIDILEYEKSKVPLTLMGGLAKGKKVGEENGWLSSDDMRKHFRAKTNEA